MISPIPTSMIITSTPVPLKITVDSALQIVKIPVAIPSPIINGFDIRQLLGLGGLTAIEAFIKYLQNQWRVPEKGLVPVIIALLSGIILNDGIAWYLHMDLVNAFIVGVFTGVSANIYHEATK